MYPIFFFLVLLCLKKSLGFTLFGPSIECTVIKVYSTTKALGFDEFPKLYQSINNDPLSSNLVIAGKKNIGVKPEILIKTDNFEKITISINNDKLELHLNGKPLSRNGTLSINGKVLAEITCH